MVNGPIGDGISADSFIVELFHGSQTTKVFYLYNSHHLTMFERARRTSVAWRFDGGLTGRVESPG
jgi:hypothetical protein